LEGQGLEKTVLKKRWRRKSSFHPLKTPISEERVHQRSDWKRYHGRKSYCYSNVVESDGDGNRCEGVEVVQSAKKQVKMTKCKAGCERLVKEEWSCKLDNDN